MLVSCLVLKNFGGWYSGMVAGFDPADVAALAAKGYVQPMPVEAPQSSASEPAVDIPADWRDQHHFTMIALAKVIAGGAVPDQATKDWAVSTIEAELARRATSQE